MSHSVYCYNKVSCVYLQALRVRALTRKQPQLLRSSLAYTPTRTCLFVFTVRAGLTRALLGTPSFIKLTGGDRLTQFPVGRHSVW